MTEQTNIPKLTKDEAADLGSKLSALDKQLSEKQRTFLKYAVNSVSRTADSEVQGYDWWTAQDTGYYDMSTGLEIYRVDFYDNYGNWEGYEYVED